MYIQQLPSKNFTKICQVLHQYTQNHKQKPNWPFAFELKEGVKKFESLKFNKCGTAKRKSEAHKLMASLSCGSGATLSIAFL